MLLKNLKVIAILLLIGFSLPLRATAQQLTPPDLNSITSSKWKAIEKGVDQGLKYLASQQLPDGSLSSTDTGQPAITSLGIMAFLSRGHVPGLGPYGKTLDRAIDFVIQQQREDGLLYSGVTDVPWQLHYGSHTATYNHAIAGLMLGEVYGLTDSARAKKLRPVIEKALTYSRKLQRRPSPHERDKYGWRYYNHIRVPNKGESDLSATAWFIMFYRSAKNAEFEVPEEYVNEGVQFVKECFEPKTGGFVYGPYPGDAQVRRAMTGAGIVSLAITGHSDPQLVEPAGKWLRDRPVIKFNDAKAFHYFYSLYYGSQAMFLMGGGYWEPYYDKASTILLENQSGDGSWPPDAKTPEFGSCYTTSLATLTLTPPYQMLPIYQR
jgi:hypothetical protein